MEGEGNSINEVSEKQKGIKQKIDELSKLIRYAHDKIKKLQDEC